MGGCQHDDGGVCVYCGHSTNSCCGEDTVCEKCGEFMCYKCMAAKDACVVCTLEVITDTQILNYLLKKGKISKVVIMEEMRKKYLKKAFKKAFADSRKTFKKQISKPPRGPLKRVEESDNSE